MDRELEFPQPVIILFLGLSLMLGLYALVGTFSGATPSTPFNVSPLEGVLIEVPGLWQTCTEKCDPFLPVLVDDGQKCLCDPDGGC